MIFVLDELADSESAADAIDGTALPKKYDRICDSRTAFMKFASRSTHPPDLDSLTTEMRSSECVADALDVSFWS